MFKETITFTDYNGNERTQDLYFNLSKSELIELELSYPGGLNEYFNKLEKSDNFNKDVLNFAKDLIRRSYGVKSEDGLRFVKSQEVLDEFMQSEAYSEFFMKLITSEEYAQKFMLSIMPKDLADEVANDENFSNNLTDKYRKRLEEMKESSQNTVVTE